MSPSRSTEVRRRHYRPQRRGKEHAAQILSRITEPTTGRVRIKGRVASLLEVGTGFHPELTGRENIFLNGAILGMTRAEIQRKFDEIVAFAEIEKFLDTPVKRYSSGMYVRLAFAVAAHLEPEILIVDEVLAVGDAQFQKKCLGKMGEVAGAGRTIFFVSHNMGAIGRLCRRCLVLEQGRLRADLEPRAAIALYLDSGMRQQTARVDLMKFPARTGDGSARIVEACLRDQRGNLSSCFSIGDAIQVEYTVPEPLGCFQPQRRDYQQRRRAGLSSLGRGLPFGDPPARSAQGRVRQTSAS